MTNSDLAFFDMAPTVQAYREHRSAIIAAITHYYGTSLDGKKIITRLENLFPAAATARMNIVEISWQRSQWFHKSSTKQKQTKTFNPHEALSQTAVVPSYIDYKEGEDGKIRCSIELYTMPPGLCDGEVGQIVSTQALVHELAHSLVIAAWHNDHGPLQFPDGGIFAPEAAVYAFGGLVEGLGCGPISYYSAGFWENERKLVLTEGEGINYQVPLQEELCETIAAYLLGFVHHPNRLRSVDPLYDRPEASEWVRQFLNATLLV